MKIGRIRCHIISHPRPAPLRPAWAPGRTFTHTASTLVEPTTDEGLTGLGAPPHADAIGLQTVAAAPGFGFKLDWEAIRACTVHTWESEGSR
jgi:L-alanine-DL-glutamate epimerase-like enolase superfamily enzyme